MSFDIDTIKLNLRPVKLISESNRKIINIIKKIGYNDTTEQNYMKSGKNNNYDKIDKIDNIYNFVYTNLKKINVKKSIEEFESDTESENDEDYASDLEY